MFKRFFFTLCLIPLLWASGFSASVFADDLSKGLELYHARKYQEAIPYLERAANDGHEKAIEALDQIYEKENKVSANGMKPVDKAVPDNVAAKDQANNKADANQDTTASEAEKKENAKGSFWRKVIAIFFALGIAIIWFIHRTILRRKREQRQNNLLR